jgi:AcrR family transcriptional regulator
MSKVGGESWDPGSARASTPVPPGAFGPPDHQGLVAGEAKADARLGKGERTRRKLLAAAEEIFGAVGYHDASIVKITEAANVAQGTFYLYFSSKREIFDEVVIDLNQRIRHAMSEAARGATTRLEAERLGFAGFFRFTSQHPALYRVIRQAEFVSPKVLRYHYETIVDHYAPFLADAMDTGEVSRGDPTVLAWSLAAVGEAVGMRWILWNEERVVPPQVFEEMMAIIARMLGGASMLAPSGEHDVGVTAPPEEHEP